jgi:hypothetical protein
MSQKRTLSSILPFLLGGGIVLLGCMLIGGTLFFAFARPQSIHVTATPAAIAASTRVSSFPTATIPPSVTPTPTNTFTPAPTATPPATNTPVPPTKPPATKVPPTAVPTDTPIPPTSAPPGAAHNITVFYFEPLHNAFARNTEIGFRFKIKNTGSNQVGYGFLGANCVDMAGNYVFFQPSWQGPDAGTKKWMNPGDEIEWTDFWHGGIPNPGTYQIQLAICYSTPGECNTAGGDWESLSPFTQITIN